ncbi:MAG: site-specific DNA-methyltransferase [Planctomycetia bacterium]|nr:site-specific DNA-methyltransferase [Planctomycetia bacterium]
MKTTSDRNLEEEISREKETRLVCEKIVSSLKTEVFKPAWKNRAGTAALYCADALRFMDALIAQYPNGIFDMIFADPPYYVSGGGSIGGAGKKNIVRDRFNELEKNHRFNLNWLERCQKLLRPNGSIWVSGTYHAVYSAGFAMQQLGMRILNNITWEKSNPPPNLSCRCFTHSTETLIWAARDQHSKYRFNDQEMRKDCGGKQMKSVWLFTAASKQEKVCGKHPTQKPLALLERVIESCTLPGELIFDPFAGSCTTGVAALLRNRCFIGCELDEKYVRLSQCRFERHEKPLVDLE